MSDSIETKELTVNQFPTLTWNFMRINNSKLEADEGAFETSAALAETSLPAGITALDGDIETLCTCGMGKDIDALFEAVKDKIPATIYTVAENAKAESVKKSEYRRLMDSFGFTRKRYKTQFLY